MLPRKSAAGLQAVIRASSSQEFSSRLVWESGHLYSWEVSVQSTLHWSQWYYATYAFSDRAAGSIFMGPPVWWNFKVYCKSVHIILDPDRAQLKMEKSCWWEDEQEPAIFSWRMPPSLDVKPNTVKQLSQGLTIKQMFSRLFLLSKFPASRFICKDPNPLYVLWLVTMTCYHLYWPKYHLTNFFVILIFHILNPNINLV